MSPQPKKFESNAEKQKAFRERKKKSLLQKLKDSLNGKSNEDIVQDNEECLIPNAEIQQKPIGTAIFLPPRENAPSTKSTIGSTEQALKSKKSGGRCELCGILLSPREGSRCGNCQQFQSKEEMLYARDLRRRLIRSSNSTVNTELERIAQEAMKKWRLEHNIQRSEP